MSYTPPGPPGPQPPARWGLDEVGGYLRRWQQLGGPAWLFLLHAALLTFNLAMVFLLFNLAIEAFDLPPFAVLGYELPFLGVLGSSAIIIAGIVALPLLWLVSRIGFWWALVINALLQTISIAIFGLWPERWPLLMASALTGVGGALYQMSSVPFMIRVSDNHTRDHLFSANFAVNIGVGGFGSLIGGLLAVWLAQLLGVPEGSATAYQAVFLVASAGLLLSLVPLLLLYRVAEQVRSHEPTASDPATSTEQSSAEAGSDPPERAATEFWLWHGWAVMIDNLADVVPLIKRIPQPWYGALRRPWPIVRFMIPPLIIASGAALLIPYLNLFFTQRFEIGEDTLGAIFAVLGLSAGLAALLGPLISIRLGKMQTILVTQGLSLPFLFILGFVPLLWVAVGAAVMRQALFNMSSPLYDAYAMERTPEVLRPTVIAAINGSFAAGYLVMPLVSTSIQRDYGFAPLFLMTGSCYALAMVANYLLFLRPEQEKYPAQQTSVEI